MIVSIASAATNLSAGINAHPRNFIQRMQEEISQLKSKVDIVINFFTLGIERHYYPTAYQKRLLVKSLKPERILSLAIILTGFKVWKFIREELFAYSLGNFLFVGKSPRIESFILKIEIFQKITTVELLPIWVVNGLPETSTDSLLIQKIKEVNKPFTPFPYEDDKFVYRMCNHLD